VDFVPPVTGNYNLLTVNAGPAWSANNASLLTIPDDWTWVPKWGALYDLLSRESNAKDGLRAEYCKRRYEEGLALLDKSPTVLALRLNDVPMSVNEIRGGDDYNPSWQAVNTLPPTAAYLTANLIAFGTRKQPEGSGFGSGGFGGGGFGGGATWTDPYVATVTVVQNAPVPQNGTDFIQVAKDDYDTILDYAQHLALFKTGGSEFLETVTLYQKFQRKAAQYNGKLFEMGFFELPMLDLGTMEEVRNARYSPGKGPDGQG